MFLSCFHDNAIKITEDFSIDKLGDSNVDWLFFKEGEGIIGGIEKVGYNNEFIIVKAGISEYYIINYKDSKKKYFEKRLLLGPYDKNTFLKKKKEINIEDINFSIFR